MADNIHHPLPSPKELITSIISELASYKPTIAAETGVLPTPSKNTTATTTSTLQPAQNRLAKLSEDELSRVKPLLLTLHCLFTNEFLPALDILDRKLVRKLVVTSNDGLKKNKRDELYFVRSMSSSSPSSRWRRRQWQRKDQDQLGNSAAMPDHHFHEVRLRAWNCSCPEFTLASFRDFSGDGDDGALDAADVGGDYHLTDEEWVFGDGDGGCISDGRREIIKQLRGLSGDENTEQGRETPVVVCKHLLACVLGSKCPGLFNGGIEEVAVNIKEAAGWCAGW